MGHPDVFGAVYALSPGLFAPGGLAESQMFADPSVVEDFLTGQAELAAMPPEEAATALVRAMGRSGDARFSAAYGAAFAPDPTLAPPWIRYPFTDPLGQADPDVWATWEGGFGGLAMSVDDRRDQLLALRGIVIDVGMGDEYRWIPPGCRVPPRAARSGRDPQPPRTLRRWTRPCRSTCGRDHVSVLRRRAGRWFRRLTMERLGPLDSLFLHVEDGVTHMHIASCAIFERPPPPYDDVVALVASKLPRLPRYRQKVRFVPGDLGAPVWVDDPHFNLAYHVRHSALPPPGGEAELNNLMGRLMAVELDRHRPLWEVWMVEGLTGGRWALISKVHHCMVDGVSGTDLMVQLLDDDRHPADPPPDAEWAPAAGAERGATRRRRGRRRVAHPCPAARCRRWPVAPPARVVGRVPEHRRRRHSARPRSAAGPDALGRGGDRATPPVGGRQRLPRRLEGDPQRVRRDGQRRRALGHRRGLSRPAAAPRRSGRRCRTAFARARVGARARRPSANNQVSALIASLPIGVADPVERLGATVRDGEAEGLARGPDWRVPDDAGRVHTGDGAGARRCGRRLRCCAESRNATSTR